MLRAVTHVVLGALCALSSATARAADDDGTALLAQPIEYTNVLDAFEDDEPPDVDAHIAFTRSVRSGRIEREVDRRDGRGLDFLAIADSTQVENALVLGVDAGVYRDLMLYVRVPLVLKDTRELTLPAAARCGSGCAQAKARIDGALDAPAPGGSGASALFALSPAFRAKTRSGVPGVDLGIAWGVTNQYRAPHLPTWVLGIESRLGAGDDLAPCGAGDSCDPGVGRGTTRLRLSTRWSYRFRLAEPYLGLAHAFEWAQGAAARFAPRGELPGYVDPGPPAVTDLVLGIAVIPWESRGRQQRLTLDLRGQAAYVSQGRDYSPLFDALGTSHNVYLTTENPDRLAGGAPFTVPFTGLTSVDAHARLGLETAVGVQAARYVRFRVGIVTAYGTTHLLTNAPPCNPEVDGGGGGSGSSAGDCAPGLYNPLHRIVLDTPGRRFRLAGELAFDLFTSATGQF